MRANVRMMYLRSGNLFREFVVEKNTQVMTRTGRAANCHIGDGSEILKGCLAEATDEDRKNHSQNEHIVTHTIVQSGKAIAKKTDKLILGHRVFYVVDIDDCGSLGISTIYYAEERPDVR